MTVQKPKMPAVDLLFSIYALFFGLLLGSFIGLAAVRLPRGESLCLPRSHCRSCQRRLSWYDNIPLLSYLFLLRGRCRGCHAKISPHYVLAELLTALVTLLAYWQIVPVSRFVLYELCFILPVLLLIFIDLDSLILPNFITLPGILIGLGVRAADVCFFSPEVGGRMGASLFSGTVGAALGFVTLAALSLGYRRWRGQAGLGMGDAKMAAMLGAFFGAKAIFFIFFLASCFGLLLGGGLLLTRRISRNTPLPFGAFLGLASLAFLLYGPVLLESYLSWVRRLII